MGVLMITKKRLIIASIFFIVTALLIFNGIKKNFGYPFVYEYYNENIGAYNGLRVEYRPYLSIFGTKPSYWEFCQDGTVTSSVSRLTSFYLLPEVTLFKTKGGTISTVFINSVMYTDPPPLNGWEDRVLDKETLLNYEREFENIKLELRADELIKNYRLRKGLKEGCK